MAKRIQRPFPRQDRAITTRHNLLRSGLLVIGEVGRDRITSALVARKAGVSIGTFYRYFNDAVEILEYLYPDKVEGLGEPRPPEKWDEPVANNLSTPTSSGRE